MVILAVAQPMKSRSPKDRDTQKENGESGVGVDRGCGDRERPGELGLLVAGQLSDVEVGWDIVLAYQMRPYVEEFAMADSRERRR